MMNTLQRILKNTFMLFFSSIISQIIGFVGIIYLARILGPQDFGKINFAMAVIAYFTLITNMGLPWFGTREIARNPAKLTRYLETILMLRLCLAISGFALLVLLTYALNPSTEITYLILLYGFGLIPSAFLLDWVFQGVEKMEHIALARILFRGIETGLLILFVNGPEDLLRIPCFQVAGNLIPAVLLIVIFIRTFGRFRVRFDYKAWKHYLALALPMGLSIIMVQVYQGSDRVMLGIMRTNEEVGLYSAAYKIIMVLIVAVGACGQALYPVISSYFKTAFDELSHILQLTTRVMVSITLPLAVGGTVIAKPIFRLLYGPEYDEGIIALQIMLWLIVIMSINTVKAWGLLACNRQNHFFVGSLITAASNVILNFSLIPALGLAGAAIASVLSEGIAGTIYHKHFSKIMKVPFLNPMLKALPATVAMGIFLFFIMKFTVNPFVLTGSGASAYFLCLFMTKGITREDLQAVKSVIR